MALHSGFDDYKEEAIQETYHLVSSLDVYQAFSPPASRADLQRVEYTEKTDFLCGAEDRRCLWLWVV